MEKIRVFKRFVNEFNLDADLLRKTSMTIPKDALSVQEIFELYLEGSADIVARIQERQCEYDGEYDEVKDMQPLDKMDAIAAFELSETLKERRLAYEQSKEHIQDNNKELVDVIGDSGNTGQESSGQEVNS